MTTTTTARALSSVRRTAKAATSAASARDAAIRDARDADPPATVRAIAEASGLSPARVHQIIHGR